MVSLSPIHRYGYPLWRSIRASGCESAHQCRKGAAHGKNTPARRFMIRPTFYSLITLLFAAVLSSAFVINDCSALSNHRIFRRDIFFTEFQKHLLFCWEADERGAHFSNVAAYKLSPWKLPRFTPFIIPQSFNAVHTLLFCTSQRKLLVHTVENLQSFKCHI